MNIKTVEKASRAAIVRELVRQLPLPEKVKDACAAQLAAQEKFRMAVGELVGIIVNNLN